MAKHLGMSERTMIEKGLILGNSFHVIGRTNDLLHRIEEGRSRWAAPLFTY